MSTDKLLRKAIEKHENLEYEEASKLYRKILSTKPRHLDANYLLGALYAECDDYENAKQHLVRASLINPNSPMVQVNLGNVYRKLGNHDLALKCFGRARQLAPNLFQAHLGFGSTLLELDEDYEKATDCFQKALALAPNVPEIYHQRGMLFVKIGNLDEGLKQLEIARSMNPNMTDINLDIGLVCLRAGKTEQAAEYFREACRISPDNIKSTFYLEITEGRTPENELLHKYSQIEFNSLAATFEAKLVKKLKYTLPFKVFDTLKRICGSDFRFDSVVDLGCGTGLTGEALRCAASRLTGIDISDKMIELANGKKCFDQLYCGDLVATLNAIDSRFDLFVATDVLIYIGEIDTLMTGIVSHASPGAFFLFSTEILAGEGLLLQKSGRYAHSSGYVHAVMKAHGCAVVSEDVIDLRLEGASWIKGNLFVVRLPGG